MPARLRPRRKERKAPENLPWTRFHPATPPYQPTDAEKQQIQAKIDQLGAIIRELRSRRADDALLADVEIYYEAARWKMAYPEEFFRQRSVADTLAVLDKGLERAAQLKEGKSPWTTQKGRVVRGYRSALDDSVQPVRVTVPDEYDGTRAFPLDVAQHGRFTSLYEVETLNSWQGAEIDYLPGTLQIDLFGRGKNTYHWPGEADIFEAIAFAKRSLQSRFGTDDASRLFHGRRRACGTRPFISPISGRRLKSARETTRRTESRFSIRCLLLSRRCAGSSTTCTSGRSMRTIFRLPLTSARTTGASSSTTAPGNS